MPIVSVTPTIHKPTLADVAKLAGVSKMAVSAVLNNGGNGVIRIGEETAKLIREAAGKLAYSPNYMASSLSNGRTNCIGFICGAIYSGLLSSLIDAAESRGYRLMAMLTKWDVQKELSCIEMAMSRMVDGVIIYGYSLSKETETKRKLLQKAMPVVIMGGMEGNGFPIVRNNFHTGMKQTFEELHAKGHRSIALLHISSSLSKLPPYREQCKNFGYAAHEIQFNSEQPDDRQIAEACSKIASLRPDAIMIEGAIPCLRIIRGLSAIGIQTPEDISTVCIGEEDWLELSHPAIPAIGYDAQKNSRQAIDALISIINGRVAPAVQFTETFLMRGDGIIDRRKHRKGRCNAR